VRVSTRPLVREGERNRRRVDRQHVVGEPRRARLLAQCALNAVCGPACQQWASTGQEVGGASVGGGGGKDLVVRAPGGADVVHAPRAVLHPRHVNTHPGTALPRELRHTRVASSLSMPRPSSRSRRSVASRSAA
jgi:hypothetical protein